MLYKLTKNIFNIMLKLVNIYKFLLTFFRSYDMLIMLGRLLEPPLFLHICKLFLPLLSTFTWKRHEFSQLLFI